MALDAIRRWLVGREAARLAALVASGGARVRGVGDGAGGGLDDDLETLDPRSAFTTHTGRR